MLAGFLAGVAEFDIRLTCASAFDLDSQKHRFPQVEWLPYDGPAREAAMDASDAWVGVGDTPFQIVVGPWFLEHLEADLELCRRHRKPMFFLGVGVNEPGALDDRRARQVLEYASHIWARDARSAELLENCGAAGKVSQAADLAHVWLRGRVWPKVEHDVIGYVLNFEDLEQFNPQAVADLVEGGGVMKHRWLVQETRPLQGSEQDLLSHLPQNVRSRLDVRTPAYARGTLEELVSSWGVPGSVVSSRYHAGLIAAWSQAHVLMVERNEKVRGLAGQIQLTSVPSFRNANEIRRKLDEAKRVERRRLEDLADQAIRSCRELLDHVRGDVPITTTPSPRALVELASVEAMNSPRFVSFMKKMNAFANSFGLRQFTNWTKIWEYPWLWHHALADINWAGKHVVDLGSELSPMPWFLATLGAKVVLIEADPQWVAPWEELRDRLKVDVSWHIVPSETIPVPDRWADVVTSFSVIEHQRDKVAAVAEVARVLKPDGLFAVSFDICEEPMGMSFPAWNGKALTIREFEDVLWMHPAFGNSDRPPWNLNAIGPFLAWHRTTAPHHNYVAGAAAMYRL